MDNLSYSGRGRSRTRRMGQHFLADRGVAARIVDSLGVLDEARVLEIGPGRGALTHMLADRAASLTALELDSGLAAGLEREFSGRGGVEVLRQDVLRFDIARWAADSAPLRPVVVGNIPYSITNDLLHQLIGSSEELGVVVLMLQKEVARKLTAPPGGKPYGMITVLCGYHAGLEYQFSVGRANFVPPPRVDSAVVRIDFNHPHRPRAADYARFDYLVRRLFEDRRKQVQKVLRKGSRFRLDAVDIPRLAETSDIDLDRRPEELSVDEFVRLADELAQWDVTA